MNQMRREIMNKHNNWTNDGSIRIFNEGYEKKGGVNTGSKTPRPADPKPQSSEKKTMK